MTAARRRRLVALTLAAPWLLLLAAELALRAGGVGGRPALFVPYAPEPGWRFVNPDFARRYFRGGFVPTPPTSFFPDAKPAGGFRVVFQGESSAAGFPYGHGGAPSRMLLRRLEADLPGRPVEVINTAFTAVNSYTLLDQADEVVAQRPDAVLIYAGHNEYYGALGAASTRALGGSRPLVRAALALGRLRTAQLLGALAARVTGATLGPGGPAGADGADAPRSVMQLMAGDQLVPLGSPLYERGLAQFRANLAELLARYREAGIPTFVGTVASNERDQPPFVSAPAAPGDTAAAAHFALARAADARGDAAAARRHYRAAKERDALRFRAPEAVNRIIREEAARAGATVVESQAALERASPGGVVGRTLMLEHLHPNLDGYLLIADAFYRALRARGLPAAAPAGAPNATPLAQVRADLPVTAVDSIGAEYRTGRLTAQWPFQPAGVSRVAAVDTLTPRTPAERLAQALVRGALPWAAATDQLREAYEGAGDADNATRAARALADEFPYTPRPLMEAARLAVGRGRYAEALAFARRALARRETAEAAELAGLLTLRLGVHAAALPLLERAAQLAPGDQRMAVARDAARELPAMEAARASAPGDTALLFNLAAAYALTSQAERAHAAIDALERAAPGHAGARDLRRRLPPRPAGPAR